MHSPHRQVPRASSQLARFTLQYHRTEIAGYLREVSRMKNRNQNSKWLKFRASSMVANVLQVGHLLVLTRVWSPIPAKVGLHDQWNMAKQVILLSEIRL